MKSAVLKTFVATASVTLAPLFLSAQPLSESPPNVPRTERPADSQRERDWQELLESRRQTETSSGADAQAARISSHRSVADKAREFYTRHSDDTLAAEARRIEVLSLISALEAGDAAGSSRLEQAVFALRNNPQIPNPIRAQGVAAFEFTRGLRDVSGLQARLDATERIARSLVREFPGESPAYEALWAVTKARPQEESARLAQEILASDAPVGLKAAAQALLDRYALIGQPLVSALDESGAKALAIIPKGVPLIVYSWASSGLGSLEFGRMIQARRFAALAVCLDENTAEAGRIARSQGLGGEHLFDEAGLQGPAATRAFSI